jgi:uncharacterized UPF0146 family protein
MKYELSFSHRLAAFFTKIKEAPQSKDSQCTILKDDSFKESLQILKGSTTIYNTLRRKEKIKQR